MPWKQNPLKFKTLIDEPVKEEKNSILKLRLDCWTGIFFYFYTPKKE